MVYEKGRWWTAVLLLIVIGAVGCGGASNDAGGTASQTTSQDAQSEGQKQALAKAQAYLDLASYSKKGLIEWLRDDGGYSKADATFAANNVEANWVRNALETALIYYDTRPYSKDETIRALTRVEQFTPAQARDAASKLYDSGGTASQATPQDAQSETPVAEKQPARTSGQKQALAAAETYYSDSGPGSKEQLITALRAQAYPKADVTFAANNVEVDWNRRAFQRGRSFLAEVPRGLSKDAMYWLLTLLEQFTPAEARYAVNELY